MKIGRKPGIVRRPLEYILIALIVFLISALLIINFSLKRYDKQGTTATIEENNVLQGTLSEVGDLADKDEAIEKSLDDKYDSQELEAASADSAADDVGSVYDETSY